jgi:hypothetical protein
MSGTVRVQSATSPIYDLDPHLGSLDQMCCLIRSVMYCTSTYRFSHGAMADVRLDSPATPLLRGPAADAGAHEPLQSSVANALCWLWTSSDPAEPMQLTLGSSTLNAQTVSLERTAVDDRPVPKMFPI